MKITIAKIKAKPITNDTGYADDEIKDFLEQLKEFVNKANKGYVYTTFGVEK